MFLIQISLVYSSQTRVYRARHVEILLWRLAKTRVNISYILQSTSFFSDGGLRTHLSSKYDIQDAYRILLEFCSRVVSKDIQRDYMVAANPELTGRTTRPCFEFHGLKAHIACRRHVTQQ